MSMRTQIQQVLDQAASLDAAWAEVIEESGNHPPAKAWEADDDARRSLSYDAVQVLHDLVAMIDKGEPLTLTPEPREAVFMVWDGGPEQEEYEVLVYDSPHGEKYDEVTLLEHGAIYTVCPWCYVVNGGITEVDRAERWNESEIEVQPDTVGIYGVLNGGGYGRIGSESNPLAGLPMLSIWVDKNADFHTERHECGRCGGEVLLPEWVTSKWP